MYVLYFIVPLVCTLIYAISQIVLATQSASDMWPIGTIVIIMFRGHPLGTFILLRCHRCNICVFERSMLLRSSLCGRDVFGIDPDSSFSDDGLQILGLYNKG